MGTHNKEVLWYVGPLSMDDRLPSDFLNEKSYLRGLPHHTYILDLEATIILGALAVNLQPLLGGSLTRLFYFLLAQVQVRLPDSGV